MVQDKGKGRDYEPPEVNGNVKTVYSAIVASAASLTRNMFSTITSHELLRNSPGELASLNKGQLSNSSSNGSSPYVEGSMVILPKLSQSCGFNELRVENFEQYCSELEKEYSTFLSNSYSMRHTTRKSIGPSIFEQEQRDGEETVRLLMSFAQEDYEQEVPNFVNTVEFLSSSGINNYSQLPMKESLNCSIRPPVNLLEKSTFKFLPSFETPLSHHNQWMDLQENYTEKVWGDRWEAIENPKQANKNSSQIKSRQYQNIAKRRLQAICCHLQQKNPKLESHFLL